MDELSLGAQLAILGAMLLCSAFFSMSETAMMASNRIRLRHAAQSGNRGAVLALVLLGKTDHLLGVILLGNTLVNAAAAVLTGNIALRVLGGDPWALEIGTLAVTLCLLIFSEITPKVAGATYPDWLTPRISFVLTPLLRLAYPVVWSVNLFVQPLLVILRLKPASGHDNHKLSPEEVRSVVLESGHFIPNQHREILLNLFELQSISVGDIMLPRGQIEAIDIAEPINTVLHQLATSYHSRVMVCEGDLSNIIGVLHRRILLQHALDGEVTHETVRQQLVAPYFIPAATPIYTQMQFFRENRQKFGLVVDEYGEILGLVTLEAIVEEIIGKFTTSLPGVSRQYQWDSDGTATVDGMAGLRELNRQLDLELPVDGPRTLNGLIVEYLQEIPESGVSLQIEGVRIEILQTEDRKIRSVRLQRAD